jgi:hypothetical protein
MHEDRFRKAAKSAAPCSMDISVTEMPNARVLAAPLKQHVEQGYQVLTWSDGKIRYWAVSDAAADELKSVSSRRRILACPLWVISGH